MFMIHLVFSNMIGDQDGQGHDYNWLYRQWSQWTMATTWSMFWSDGPALQHSDGPASRKHYVNGTLSFLQHGEGRTLYNAGSFDYEYNLTGPRRLTI